MVVKKNLRRIYGLVMAVTTLVTMVSLAGTSLAAKEKVKIKVWTQSRHDANYMTGMVNKFNKENKDNIEIDYQIYSDNYQQTLDLAFATGEAPDVFYAATDVFEKRLALNELTPLNKFLTPADMKRFGKGAFIDRVDMANGKIYLLPAIGTTTRLVYNKGIFKRVGINAPPQTVAEMVKDAKLISDKLGKEGIFGYAQNFKSPASAIQRSIDLILMRSGGPTAGYDFKTGKYDFTGYKPILKAYRDIFTTNGGFPGCESLDIDPLRTQFAAGKIGMYISYTHAEPGVYQNQFPTKEDWDMAPLPTINGKVKGSNPIILAGGCFLMSGKTKHSEESWKVMKYLYSDELLAGYHENGLGIVLVPSVLKKARVPETIKKWPAVQFDKNDKIWPKGPAVRPEGKDMYQVFVEIIYGVTDLDKGLDDLNNRYNSTYNKAISDGRTERIIYPGFDPANPGKVFKQ